MIPIRRRICRICEANRHRNRNREIGTGRAETVCFHSAFRLPHSAFAWVVLLGNAMLASAQEEPPESPATQPETEVSAEAEALPKLADMRIPTADELMRGKPYDWVVLRNEDVLVVEPISPRPDTLAKMEEEHRKLGTVKGKTTAEMEAIRQRRRELLRLVVTLKEATEDPDYSIETKLVKQVIHHEDHVLARADLCLQQDQTALAFELLVYLDRRHHHWPGYERMVNRLLSKEAELHQNRGDSEAAWRFAEELYGTDPKFAGLAELAGRIIDSILQTAVERHDYRMARHFLRRLAVRDAEHPAVERWGQSLLNRTQEEIERARAASAEGQAGRASDLIDQAARIWPATPGLKEAHRQLTDSHQLLRVGVLELPTEEAAYPFPTRAQRRWDSLRLLPWFEVARFDSTGPHYRSIPCEGWEPDDLGRELRFAVRRHRAEWESRPRMTSATLMAELNDRRNPQSPKYDERLASNIVGLAAPSPFEVMLKFRRPPLKPEALFGMPLTATAESPDLNPDWASDGDPASQRFRQLSAGEREFRAGRTRLEPPAAKVRHLAELVERRYDDWDQLLQGLQRGEISAVPHVDPIDLASLKGDERYFILSYAQPMSHVIQFHSRSVVIRNGQLRRALLHTVNREQLLNDQFFAGSVPQPAIARLTSSPFTMATAEYNRLLPAPESDPILAAGLAATARKQLGGTLPPLRIAIPPEREIRRTVEAMIAQWKRVGIEVVPVQSASEDWDLAYRTVHLHDPVVDLWPFLTVDPSSRVDSLTPFPERIRRQLMELERAANWPAAIQNLHRLQADMLIDAWWIPLWEIDEFCLFRRNVTGLPEEFVTPYQDAERWIVQSWYPTDPP